jgi:hypothetical protein
MCKKSAKTDKEKIREILAPHLLQRGPSFTSPPPPPQSAIRGTSAEKFYGLFKDGICISACEKAVSHSVSLRFTPIQARSGL